jgi:AcrR family transcriptional regulator
VPPVSEGSRRRLLDAADELLSAEPSSALSLREVCARAGVQLPTLYHFFDSKRGLLDALASRGFDRLAGSLDRIDETAPLAALARAWDAHLAAAREHPALYVLMYGAGPGERSPSATAAHEALMRLARAAAGAGMLRSSAAHTAWRLETATVGAALAVIADPAAPSSLVSAARDELVASLARAEHRPTQRTARAHAGALQAALHSEGTTVLRPEEAALLLTWLGVLAESD